MFCGSCGAQIKEGAKFCPNCGWNVPVTSVKTPDITVSEDKGTADTVNHEIDKVEKCPNCGKQIDKEWLVCPYCKAEIKRERLCANCGKKLDPDWVICPFCKTAEG